MERREENTEEVSLILSVQRKSIGGYIRGWFLPSLTMVLSVDHLVDQVREALLDKWEAKKSSFHERDVERLKETDRMVERFLLHYKADTKRAVKALTKWFIWRKRKGINDFKESDFPRELYEMGVIVIDKDSNQTPVIYFRLKLYVKAVGWRGLFNQWIAFMLDLADQHADGKKFGLVFDATGATFGQLDLTFIFRTMTLLTKPFSLGIKYICIYNPSWTLRFLVNGAIRLLPIYVTDLIQVVDVDSIDRSVLADNMIPDFMQKPTTYVKMDQVDDILPSSA